MKFQSFSVLPSVNENWDFILSPNCTQFLLCRIRELQLLIFLIFMCNMATELRKRFIANVFQLTN